MNCVACVGAAISERPERTAQGYRRFRCRDCGKQFNERTGGPLNRTSIRPMSSRRCLLETALQTEPARSAGDVPSPRYRIHLKSIIDHAHATGTKNLQ